MRWPWRKPKADLPAARAAEKAAHRDRPRVDVVAARAERLKERNGFTEAIRAAMGVKQ